MTTPDKMTLAELEKALKSPTPGLIRELSKQVVVAQGNCAHENVEHKYLGKPDYWSWECSDCPETWHFPKVEYFIKTLADKGRIKAEMESKIKNPPDVTRPKVFWPLAGNCTQVLIHQVAAPFKPKSYIVNLANHIEGVGWFFGSSQHPIPGAAVGVAFLKIKAQEGEK